ncbi:hypothetical protein [Aquimarina sp. LLG6339-5]|uniref:hypothetical protein n=1 Tax=Aquimarina sp. LLG6339-5 TaxID=3160830 RepID=UPI003865436F
MKHLLKFTSVLFLTLVISSCSSDDNSKNDPYTYKSEKVDLNKLITHENEGKTKVLDIPDGFIQSEFKTSLYIPKNLSNSELEDYLSKNQKLINGTLEYFINDKKFIKIDIVEGVKINVTSYENYSLQKKYPCTYSGIQDCVQHAVYEEWSTIEALICAATGGLECIAIEAAACVEQNCF